MTAAQAFLIDTRELAGRLGEPDLAVFDVSAGPVPVGDGKEIPAAEAFAAAHIPGAAWIDQAKVLSDTSAAFNYTSPSPEAIASAFQALGVGPRTTVVLYSAGNYGWPTRVWLLLRSIGFDRAYILDGGLPKWQAEGLPLEQGEAASRKPAADPLLVRPRTVFVGRERVLKAVQQGDATIVDSLPPTQYDGTAASKHGRRGHIQGAVNLPSGTLLKGPDNAFKDEATHRNLFGAAGVDGQKPIITYCGGGIAASVGAFAALRAGYDDVVVYDASLAEWARDSSLPMVPGTPS